MTVKSPTRLWATVLVIAAILYAGAAPALAARHDAPPAAGSGNPVPAELKAAGDAREPAAPGAPSIHITSPSGTTLIGEGGDYAAEVLGDAWDMNSTGDIYLVGSARCGNPWPQYSNVNASGGVWNGTVISNSSYPPMIWLVNPSWRTGALATGKQGDFNKIDASHYYYLTLRMKLSSYAGGTNPPLSRLRWTNGSFEDPPDPSPYWSWSRPFHIYPDNQWHIYTFDMRSMQPDLGGTLAWTGLLTGLAIFPDVGVGPTVSIDWARLSGADSLHHVAWTGSYQSGASVTFSLNDTPVHVYTPGSWQAFYYEPSAVAASAGQYDLPVPLPAGSYTLKATVRDGSGTTTSAGAGPWQVDAAPLPSVISPAAMDGGDFMTAVTNGTDPWDMDAGGGDLASWTGFNYISFAGNILDAHNSGSAQTCAATDPQLLLRMRGATIDTHVYHWLTVGMYVGGNAQDIGDGWIMRFGWFEADYNQTRCGMTNDIVVWPGWNTYSIDLNRSDILEPVGPCLTLWQNMPNGVQHLRIDPVESSQQNLDIKIDWVNLTKGPLAGTATDIRWQQDGMQGQNGTMRLYYDTDRNPNNGKTLITSGNGPQAAPQGGDWLKDLPAAVIPRVYLPLVRATITQQAPSFCTNGTCSYHWNTSGIANGNYYIYVEATDGLSTVGRYSNAPLQVRH